MLVVVVVVTAGRSSRVPRMSQLSSKVLLIMFVSPTVGLFRNAGFAGPKSSHLVAVVVWWWRLVSAGGRR